MKIGIVDSGMGLVAVLNKLYDVLPADYLCYVDSANHPFGNKTTRQLNDIAQCATSYLSNQGCDVIIYACNTLSLANYRADKHILRCEPPVNTAITYTASNALVVGTQYTANVIAKRNLTGVITVALPRLATMVEDNCTENEMCRYIETMTADYAGKFDCIALGCTHYSLIKQCFERVYPNVKLFDSIDGVQRRAKKNFAKFAKGESSVKFVFTSNEEQNTEKYCKILEKFCIPY